VADRSSAARHLGWGQHTVQRYDRAATWQELVDGRWKAPRPSKLDPFKPYLDQHADGRHGSMTRLFREIRAVGYDGSYPRRPRLLQPAPRQGTAAAGARRRSGTSRTGSPATPTL
jgi:transposase